jgi:hypothetical protein
MSARRPDFYIAGAPKSGTTAMYAYLREHPDLFLPERKELRYFGRDLDIRDRRSLTMEEYVAHFSEARPDQLVGTAYVWYLYSTTAAEEIARFTPNARVVAMLRNPIEMLQALHGEHLSNGNEDIPDFASALAAEPDRRDGRRIPPHAHLPRALWYSEVPRYTEQLQRYAAVLGRERLHVVLFDDFTADTAGSYRDVLRFLGVRDDIRPAAFDVINASKRTRSERLRHFLARPPALPRRIVRTMVPRRLRRGLYERVKAMNVASHVRPSIPQETADRLRAEFADEVDRLSTFLGRDLHHWIAPGSTLR